MFEGPFRSFEEKTTQVQSMIIPSSSFFILDFLCHTLNIYTVKPLINRGHAHHIS